MSPFRLFVILVMLTATALTVVYLRTANVRTAYNVQKLHAQQVRLRYEVWDRQADIARLTEPKVIEKTPADEPPARTDSPPSGPDVAPTRQEWETD